MFLLPFPYWRTGGAFYEHSHRLVASFVGLLTTILAVWLWVKEDRVWMRWLGVIAFVAVVLQGVLGGLRVRLSMDEIGIFHAALAQLFLVLLSAIALMTSRWWHAIELSNRQATGLFLLSSIRMEEREKTLAAPRDGRAAPLIAVVLVFLQLLLGATMRHQHAGLAIPDFPWAYGKVWPPTDAASLDLINRSRTDVREPNPITAFQINLHMTHRIGAVATMLAVGWFAWRNWRRLGRTAALAKWALGWFGLICAQAALGAATVLSNKAADVATAHVVLGALSLVVGSLLCVIAFGSTVRGLADSRIGRAAGPLLSGSMGQARSNAHLEA